MSIFVTILFFFGTISSSHSSSKQDICPRLIEEIEFLKEWEKSGRKLAHEEGPFEKEMIGVLLRDASGRFHALKGGLNYSHLDLIKELLNSLEVQGAKKPFRVLWLGEIGIEEGKIAAANELSGLTRDLIVLDRNEEGRWIDLPQKLAALKGLEFDSSIRHLRDSIREQPEVMASMGFENREDAVYQPFSPDLNQHIGVTSELAHEFRHDFFAKFWQIENFQTLLVELIERRGGSPYGLKLSQQNRLFLSVKLNLSDYMKIEKIRELHDLVEDRQSFWVQHKVIRREQADEVLNAFKNMQAQKRYPTRNEALAIHSMLRDIRGWLVARSY